MSDVVILGTGKMGAAIARRLTAAGLELTLWNRTPSRAEAVGVGRVSDSLSEAVRSARIVVTSLTDPDALREVLLGPEGVLAAASGQLFVEMSTAGPGIVAELAPAVRKAGSRIIDAPILAPPRVVEEGHASVIVGGDDEDVSRARPVLDLLGTVRHVGPLGSAAPASTCASIAFETSFRSPASPPAWLPTTCSLSSPGSRLPSRVAGRGMSSAAWCRQRSPSAIS